MLIKLKIKSEKYSFDPVFSHKIIEKFNKEELVELVKKRPNKIKKRDIEGE